MRNFPSRSKINKNADDENRLFKTNVQIKQAIQSIKRVTEGDNFHKEITEVKPLPLELIKDVPIYCKIFVKGESLPARLKFDY